MPSQIYSCAKCGAQTLKWAGRCAECGAWGSLSEDSDVPAGAARRVAPAKPGKTSPFKELQQTTSAERLLTGVAALDAMLNGGLVPGGVLLFGGEPGIGKSTLLSQVALRVAASAPVLYVTGEESPSQVRLRLQRLSSSLPDGLEYLDETSSSIISSTIQTKRPKLVIVDSVQSLRTDDVGGEAGGVSQVRASASVIAEAAKRAHVPVILVGQVTKDGDLAGPRLLEHLVDAVLMLEGDRTQAYRVLRLLKHRFGPADESLLFAMTERGLETVEDPSSALLSERPSSASGSVITCLVDGSRPLLLELQALVSPAGYGTPLRRVSGLDQNRVSLLLAVLGRRAGVPLADQDVFMNAVGGFRVAEPGADLAACLALASAKYDKPLPQDMVVWGEVGLSGELRPVPRTESRLKEAARLGLKKTILPYQKKMPSMQGVTVHACKTLREAIAVTGLI